MLDAFAEYYYKNELLIRHTMFSPVESCFVKCLSGHFNNIYCKAFRPVIMDYGVVCCSVQANYNCYQYKCVTDDVVTTQPTPARQR